MLDHACIEFGWNDKKGLWECSNNSGHNGAVMPADGFIRAISMSYQKIGSGVMLINVLIDKNEVLELCDESQGYEMKQEVKVFSNNLTSFKAGESITISKDRHCSTLLWAGATLCVWVYLSNWKSVGNSLKVGTPGTWGDIQRAPEESGSGSIDLPSSGSGSESSVSYGDEPL